MANYYKLQINTSTYYLNDVVKNYTDNIFNDNYKNTNITKSSNTFNSSINEKPSALGYKYNNTDISQYCISMYVESAGSTTFTTVPVWCKKIRAILIGGGGNGKKGQNGYAGNHDVTNNVRHNVHYHRSRGFQYNYRNNYESGNTDTWNYDTTIPRYNKYKQGNGDENYDTDDQKYYGSDHRHHHGNYRNTDDNTNTDTQVSHTPYQQSGYGGGGGGGGGFIYLEDTDVVSKTVSVTTGGAESNTVLTIGSTVYTASGGSSSTSTDGGSKGGTSGTAKINSDGTDGGAASGSTAGSGGQSVISTYSSTLSSYGKGGNGSNGTPGGVNASDPQNGGNGYYRIYFIAN